MAGLADIIPASEVVHGVTIRGISFRAVGDLFARFPELNALLGGTASPASVGGDAVAAIIAAGCGCAGDPEQEGLAGNLPVDVQLDLLVAVIGLTIGKKGIGPFLQKLAALGGVADGPAPAQQKKKIRLRPFVRPRNGSSLEAGVPN